MAKIKWRGDSPPDRYRQHEAFLWGAFSHFFPGTVRAPGHPQLLEEYLIGAQLARQGFINIVARDPDPKEIVRRLKQEHELKRAERVLTKGAA